MTERTIPIFVAWFDIILDTILPWIRLFAGIGTAAAITYASCRIGKQIYVRRKKEDV